MNRLAFNARLLAALALFCLAAGASFAQVPSTGAAPGINAAFVKLFGSAAAFTAKVDTRVIDPYQQETVRMPMDYSALDGKVRLDINLAQMTNKDLPPSTISSLKQAGMDRLVSIFRPDKKATYVIYPGLQSYQSLPLAKAEAEAGGKSLKLEKSPLGKETLDGHPCVKNRVIVRNDKEPVFEALTWNATDLKDFPLQIELKQKPNIVRMRFSQVTFAKPDAKQFEVPANYGLMK